MRKKINIIKAIPDPNDGRIVVHYSLDEKKVCKFKPAIAIRRLEKEQDERNHTSRQYFKNVIEGKRPKGRGELVCPNPDYIFVRVMRDLVEGEIDLLRQFEIALNKGMLQDRPKPVVQALQTILEEEEQYGAMF